MENLGIYISFVIYLLGMLAVGYYFYKKSNNFNDYVLAGRGLNYWVTSLSAQASDMSGWLLMGLPGYAFLSGTEAVWIAFGLGLGTWLNWQFVAKRLRVYSELAGNALTIPTFLANRFNDKSHVLRLITSVFILIFFLIYTASGFVAGAKLFSSLMEVNYLTALLFSAFVIVSYTFLGGFHAVSWTDFVQGAIMFVAVILVPIVTVFHVGGWDVSMDALTAKKAFFLNPFKTSDGSSISWILLASLMGWGLGYFGQPHILARFMAIKRADEIRKAKRVAIVWVAVSLAFAVLIGLAGYVYYHGAMPDSEKVFIHLVRDQFPGMLSGFLLAAVLAAVMSTADSQLLVASTSLTEDIYRVFLRKQAGNNELLLVSRLSVLLITILALIIASNPESKVLDLVAFAWGGFGASLGPAVLFSLFWGNTSKPAVIAGIIIGGLTTILWKNLEGGIFDLYEIIPGFVLSALIIWCVSIFTQSHKKLILRKEFDTFRSKLAKL